MWQFNLQEKVLLDIFTLSALTRDDFITHHIFYSLCFYQGLSSELLKSLVYSVTIPVKSLAPAAKQWVAFDKKYYFYGSFAVLVWVISKQNYICTRPQHRLKG